MCLPLMWIVDVFTAEVDVLQLRWMCFTAEVDGGRVYSCGGCVYSYGGCVCR